MSLPRLYGGLLRLFPRPFRERSAGDAAETFALLWADAVGARARASLLVRCFGRLPLAWASEWVHHLRTHGRDRARLPRELLMDRWSRNVRQALRSLGRAPTFTWTVVLLLGLGVGAVTTIVTIVDHVLLRPLPYPAAERLIYLENGSHSGPLFQQLGSVRTVEQWAGAFTDDVNLTGTGQPERLERATVTEDFFTLFGATAARGRLLQRDDFGGPAAVVLAEGTWRRLWGGDPDLVGRTIALDGEAVVVVGILPSTFAPPEALVGTDVDVWRAVDWSAEMYTGHDWSVLDVAGRLEPGASHAAAQSELDALMVEMAQVHPNYRVRDGDAPEPLPAVGLSEIIVRPVREGLGLLLGAVAMLLLVACANVANLFLARGVERQREMAVRHALGAGRGRLVEQLMTESVLVGLVGGALGVALSVVGLRTFLTLNPQTLPREAAVHVDLRVLGFAAVLSLATALLFGLLPALRAARANLAGAVRGAARTATEGKGIRSLRGGLVVAEVALSLTLVAGAGLLLRTFLQVQGQALGIQTAGVWSIPVTPTGYDSPESWVQGMEAVRTALAEVPGVQSAALSLTVPMQMTGGRRCCWTRNVAATADADGVRTQMHPVSTDYFTTFQLPLLAGRVWTPSETSMEPAPVVVSEPLAIQVFGSATAAVGRTLHHGQGLTAQIVGVAADDRHYGAEYEHGPAAYVPLQEMPFQSDRAVFAVRMDPSATDVPARLRDAIWSVAPALPVPQVQTLDALVDDASAGRRFDSALFGSLALVALVLAAGGLYGLLLYVASQRRRDLAIRLALGASRGHIQRSLVLGGLGLTAAGVGLGLLGSWASGRFLSSRLWGVEAGDPGTLVGASLLLLAIALLASWLPARRAGRTDPLETLRQE